MMVDRQGSKVSWQNMASLLKVAGHGISRSLPKGGESSSLIKKPIPESPFAPGDKGTLLDKAAGIHDAVVTLTKS